MKSFWFRFTLLCLILAPLRSLADGSQVVVVYNKRMPGSKAVAEHYARAREVPKRQIFGFSMTTNEVMSRDQFRDSLQVPLARRLERDGLWQFGEATNALTESVLPRIERCVVMSKIRYAVLCYGVPLKIAPDAALRRAAPTNMNPQLSRNEAAVDSELAWLPLVEAHPLIDGPMRNWVYGATNAALLSPTNGILLVARLDGPSAGIAEGLVDKALQAEHDGLWGRAYFDKRGFPKGNNYYLGDEWIGDGAKICQELGFETTVDDKPQTFPADFPMSHIAIYCGWYAGNADGPFAQPTVEFMPGAFAYHLHSFSAETLRSTTQHWCGPLLAKGATCTMGCVYEPYLTGTPNVAAFLARWMAAGFTFGEAAWAAQPVLSWQTTVIGDPLYRPFGKSPALLHAELARRHSPLLEWSYLRVADLALAHRSSIFAVANYLENINATTNSAILTEKLASLYEKEGKPSSASELYERALGLGPSPEQRIRLRLELADLLEQQNQDQKAYDDYQALLRESEGYPGRTMIYRKLLALARKLNKPDEVARYEALTRPPAK